MIREEINQSWITSALTDKEAIQAIALSISLKQVGTTRKVWIVISEDVSRNMKYLLLQVFHGVLTICNTEVKNYGMGTAGMDLAVKLWSWRLTQYDKCIYLTPNHLVKKNCDELFRYEEFSAFKVGKSAEQFEPSLFVFKPSFATFEILAEITGRMENDSKNFVDVLLKHFDDWDVSRGRHISGVSIAEVPLGSEIEQSTKNSSMLRFKLTPWQMSGQGKGATKDWLKIYFQKVLPFIKKQADDFLQNAVTELMEPNDISQEDIPVPNNEEQYENTIAIVGMSCRFPGANNAAEYWKLLSEGREAIRKFPAERPFHGPAEAREMQAGFLNCPVDEFDAKFFGISPREAALVDPQQRLLLEVTWECLENAGINPQTLRDSDTGVYVGMWQQDYERIILESKREEDDKGTTDFLHVFLGNKYSATASRISFCLGLHGPAVAVESGCSSSLTGLHLACESLHKGETSLALVSGVNLILLPFNPFSGKAVDENGVVLSRDYRCKTFDESADGFVRAEACGVVALKRYEDACRDGDNILAVVRGSAINNDGAGTSFGTPNEKGQELVYRAALKRAKVAPAEVTFVEAHGTGTVVGDPIEMYAVGQAYSEGRIEPLLVGSVKTNIGHCEAAAGIASLIKVILCLQNKAIPPHRNLKNLNPRIQLDSIPARIPMELTPWKAATKIAAISSFSMSATNAHVIIQEPPKRVKTESVGPSVEMITLSGKSEEALTAIIQKYVDFLKQNENMSLKEIAYMTNVGRAHLQHRIAVVAGDTNQLLSRLEKRNFTQGKASALKTKLGFVFTGQGSQYFGMTKGLCETFPAFKQAMTQCDALFQDELNESLTSVLFKDENLLNQTLYCQPAIFCVEYCLQQLWNSYGIKPDYVLGHSVGEFAAAVSAGILSLEDGMKLVVARSKMVNELPSGNMLAVRATEEDTMQLVSAFTKAYQNKDAWIDIAAINSNEEVVLSLNSNCAKTFEDFCSNNGVKYVKIPATHAFHSRDMDPILPEFGKIAEEITMKNPTCTYISGTLAKSMELMEFSSHYWQRHLRDTVRFSDAIRVLWSDCKILIEVGPQPILLGLAMANVDDASGSGLFCPSQRRNEDPSTAFHTAMKKLYVSGIDFDWMNVHGIRQKSIELPTYPFQRQKYWIVDEAEKEEEMNPILHPLLGRQFLSPLPETIYCQMMRLKELSYMEDHKVADYVVVPAAAMLESFLAAGREILQGGSRNKFTITVENFVIEAALPLENRCSIQTLITSDKSNTDQAAMKYKLTLSRRLEQHFDKWKRHATAEFTPSSKLPDDAALDLDALKSGLSHKKSLETSYKAIADLGIQFGPRFQSIASAWYGPKDILAEINMPEGYEDYICHPIVLDAMIQTSAFKEHLSGAEDAKKALYLPVSIRKFTWLSRIPTSTVYAHGSGESGIVTLYNCTGEPLAMMEGLELIQTTVNSVLRAIREDSLEVPDFMCDRWRKMLGKMDSRVDISKMIAPTEYSPLVNTNKNTVEGLSSEDAFRLIEVINYNAFLSFCKGLQECQWPWPETDQILYAEQWKAMLPNSLNEKILGLYFYELERRGYLAEISSNSYQVLKPLPTPSESDEIIATNTKAAVETSSLIDVDLNYVERFRTCFPLVLQSKMTPLAYLFPEDESENGAVQVYKQSLTYSHQNTLVVAYFSEAIAQYQGTNFKDGILRILEVGAGSASTTVQCLEVLKKHNIPYKYTFTDISPLFLNEAKKKLGSGSEMSYQLFNIEIDPLVQGFSPEEFDIVIAVQCMHATAKIDESLVNLKKVLRVNGSLLLGEGFQPHTVHVLTWGMLEGWWRFEDFRMKSKLTALMDEEQWSEALERAGFDSISSVPGFMLGVVSARNASTAACIYRPVSTIKKWFVIDDSSNLSKNIVQNFRDQDREVVLNRISAKSSEDVYLDILNSEVDTLEGILCLCTEFGTRDTEEIQSQILKAVLSVLKSYEAVAEKFKARPKLAVVTRGVYSIGDSEPGSPNGATAWGMLKTFKNENPSAKVSLMDLDPESTSIESTQVFSQLWNQEDEMFIAFRQDKSYAMRLTYIEKPALPVQLPNTDRYKFINPASGAFTDIEIGPVPRQEPKEDEVELEVRACALNFRDLFMVMKPEGFVLPDETNLGDLESVGLDFSGIVVGLGSKVTRFQLGDEVFGLAMTGALASHILAKETNLMKMPKEMTFAEASTIPCAFMTAIISLIEVAKLNASDRVLIHVASGGVGLAAIQVVNAAGAEIYATAGNKRKRAYLRSLGIKYVYNSRDTNFGEGIERDTNGAGVTVVLNSLTGPGFKETSLKICSPGARFVEIAKMNIWQPNEVKALRPDVKYTIVDLSLKDPLRDIDSERSFNNDEQLVKIEKFVINGTYAGLPSVTYPLCKVREAFYYFQKAKHIGKIVVQIPKCVISEAGKVEHKQLIFNAKSSYMITGGLGGIGVEVVKWMRTMGAYTIILVGRSPPSETVQRLIDDWNRNGSNIVVLQTDIGYFENCQRALEFIKTQGLPPLRGIMHAAGVISDAVVSKQTPENFETVLRPKVYGGWYLHNLTINYQLEFFVMFSSLSGILGMLGQSNHAAANRFLDSLTHYRIAMGLPGTTINWGGWSDVGAAAKIALTTEVFSGMRMFTPAQGIAALEKIMTSSHSQVGVSEVVDWNLIKNVFCQGRYMEEMKSENENSGKFEQFDYLIEEIHQAKTSEDRQAKIQLYVEAVLKETLSLPATDVLDIDQNFADLGVDSLMGMEMKNRFQAILGERTLSISSMQENRTIRSLSAHVAHLMENEPLDTRPISEMIKEDVILSPEVCAAEIPAKNPSDFQNILLTGATGHLGIYCLTELLKSSQDLTVQCLVRGKSDSEAQEKLNKALSRYKITVRNPEKIQVVAGDITKERLGLSPEAYARLTEEVDGIMHYAAKVNHVDKYSDGSRHDMRTHNVAGLVNILKFASCHRTKALIYASTLFCSTKLTESGLLAEEYPEKQNMGEDISWGYLLSKFICEKLVGEATERGIPVTTIRFPVIFGHSETGYMPTGYNHVWSTILASVRVRMFPDGQLNGIPIIAVDSAAKVATQLFLNDFAERGIYNLTVGSTLTEKIVNDMLCEFGVSCEPVPFKEWRDAVFEEHDAAMMGPFKSVYQDENQESGIFSLHTLARETESMNISKFSDKMLKNFPEVSRCVTTPELVIRRQLRAHFSSGASE